MRKILLAYDGDEPAKRALEQTIDLARKFDAAVGVVSVVPVGDGAGLADPWDGREVHAEELIEARLRFREAGIEAEIYEPDGDPAQTIERVAQEHDYDVIIVGTHGLGAVSHALKGSVSEHVASHARSTVIVAR